MNTIVGTISLSRHKTRTLDCPHCYGVITLGSRSLVESRQVSCPQCGRQALVTWEWHPVTDRGGWALVDAALGAELCG